MTAKHPKTRPAPLREQITAYLSRKGEATGKDIANHTSEANFPSRVLNELNKMRADALVECEKRKGKGNEYYYWLTNAAQTGAQPQPEVGQNTGSDVSSVEPVAADDTRILPGDDHATKAVKLAVRNHNGREAAEERAAAVSQKLDDLAREYDALKAKHANYDEAVGEIHRVCHEAGIAAGLVHERVAQLAEHNAATVEEIGTIHDLLVVVLPDSDPRDPSDIPSIELAQNVADELRNVRALATKLQTLLDCATHEREALRAEIERLRKEGADAVDVLDAATAYLVRAPKRKPRILTKSEAARNAAMACARNGSGRGDVYALVHVGTAKRGAEWTEPDRNAK
jgi:hypothetical protein